VNDLKDWLTEVKERADMATEGPLEVVRFDNDDGSISYQLETCITPKNHNILAWYTDRENPKAKSDCIFAAHARTDLPTAIKVIEKLIEQRDEYTKWPDKFSKQIGLDLMNAELMAIVRGEK
jgi:hypothetical protein